MPSLDIDVIGALGWPLLIHSKTDHPLTLTLADPGLAPASEKTVPRACTAFPQNVLFLFFVAGTPEVGGWTTREVKRVIRGLAGLNFVYV